MRSAASADVGQGSEAFFVLLTLFLLFLMIMILMKCGRRGDECASIDSTPGTGRMSGGCGLKSDFARGNGGGLAAKGF